MIHSYNIPLGWGAQERQAAASCELVVKEETHKLIETCSLALLYASGPMGGGGGGGVSELFGHKYVGGLHNRWRA